MFQSAETAYNRWVSDHYRFLLRSAWALTGSRAVAEDVVQDCFASAWKHKAQLRDAALVRPWLFKIMRRSAFRHIAPAPVAPRELDEAAGTVEDAGVNDRLDVVKALSKIAPIHREVLVLYYFDDMPTVRMAEALEIAPGTVLSRLARARDALKAVLEPPSRSATAAPRANVTLFHRP